MDQAHNCRHERTGLLEGSEVCSEGVLWCGSTLMAGEGDAEPAYIIGLCMTEDSAVNLSG